MYKTAFLPYSELFYEYLESEKKNNMQVLQYHDGYEIYLLTAGERYYFINGICHILKPGDLFIVKPFEMHYSQSQDSSYYARHLLNFPEKLLESVLTSTEQTLLLNKLDSCILHLNEEQFAEVEFHFKGIANASGFLSEKIQLSHLLQLLVFLSKCMKKSSPAAITSQQLGIKPEILHAVQYINRNYAQDISLDFIAEHVHMSKYYFCRQFTKIMGVTFLEYLNTIRLAKAHQLLLNTSLPLKTIAALTGYSSAVHLSRTFRSAYRKTPAAFRRTAGEM